MTKQLKWTKEKPTKLGWYWVLHNGYVEIVLISMYGKKMTYQYTGDDDIYSVDNAEREGSIEAWYGPIPKPAPMARED